MKQDGPFSRHFYNIVTYLGILISILVVVLEVFLFALDAIQKGHNVYLGLITYIILPAFLFLGLILIPLGVFWKQSRERRGLPAIEFQRFRIDLAIPHHRNALLVFIVGTAIVVLMSLVGSYKAFHYTESTEFCGVLCHQVMSPEFTAYNHSPHGKVKCVECHIGAGAESYLKSKLSGARQVVKAMSNTYARPIHTPVESLRPAQDTCKQCHWPEKHFATMDLNRRHYLSEGGPSPWHIRMLLNVGGGKDKATGVHNHMNIDHEIYYAAEDDRRQNITWVKSVDRQGRETIYTSPKSIWKETLPPQERIRKMDCIDCHNRATHRFIAPYRFMNTAMSEGNIASDIPQIKEKSLALVSKKYASSQEGAEAIEKSLRDFYSTKHADFYAANRPKVDQAISQVVTLFKKNFFPEMGVRWDTHPDNIGHLVSPGCFRCHDNEHQSPEGKIITKDCKACHLIVEQGPAESLEKNLDGLTFAHPDGSEDWKEANCTDCHNGA